MVHRITKDEFIDRMHKKIGNDYQLISDYVDTRTKVTLKHLACGNIYQVSPNAVINNGTGCSACNHRKAGNKLKKDFVKWVKDNYDNEYTVLGEYTNARTKIKMKHNKCGTEFMACPCSFKQGHTCPKCGINKRAKKRTITDEEFKKRVYDLVGNDYIAVTPYHKSLEKVTFYHAVCGHTFQMTPNSFFGGRRCSVCNPQTPLKTEKQFLKELKEINSSLIPITHYQGVKKPITIKCTVCNNTFNTTPDRLLHSHNGCPKCNASSSEKIIMCYLDKHNIKYEYQKKFDDLKDKSYLSYDFYLPDYKLLIEYNGIQHYYSLPYFNNSHSNYTSQIKHDKMKKEYAEANNYNLLVVPYTITTSEDIEAFLNNYFKKWSSD